MTRRAAFLLSLLRRVARLVLGRLALEPGPDLFGPDEAAPPATGSRPWVAFDGDEIGVKYGRRVLVVERRRRDAGSPWRVEAN